jgi:hypothetical protein
VTTITSPGIADALLTLSIGFLTSSALTDITSEPKIISAHKKTDKTFLRVLIVNTTKILLLLF